MNKLSFFCLCRKYIIALVIFKSSSCIVIPVHCHSMGRPKSGECYLSSIIAIFSIIAIIVFLSYCHSSAQKILLHEVVIFALFLTHNLISVVDFYHPFLSLYTFSSELQAFFFYEH